MKRGFTLVELSIVLVIIGLLIGGILVAQSMISTARITSQVRQFQQFDVAVTNFRTKFGGLPADNAVIDTPGNKNGLIDCVICWIAHDANEYCNFWPQLSNTQMLVDGYIYGKCYNPAPTTVPNSTMPAAQIDKTKAIFVSTITANNKNYYTIVNKDNNTNSMIGGSGSVIPSNVAALDIKMDDGVGNTGRVVARIGGAINDATIEGTGTCLLANGNYNFVTTTTNCIPRIELQSQTSDQ